MGCVSKPRHNFLSFVVLMYVTLLSPALVCCLLTTGWLFAVSPRPSCFQYVMWVSDSPNTLLSIINPMLLCI